LDVKYKTADRPSNEDIYQVVTYSTALGVNDAWLVYPRAIAATFDINVGAVRVRTTGFDLTTDFEQGGSTVVRALGAPHGDNEA
jgi:hypothetical protein